MSEPKTCECGDCRWNGTHWLDADNYLTLDTRTREPLDFYCACGTLCMADGRNLPPMTPERWEKVRAMDTFLAAADKPEVARVRAFYLVYGPLKRGRNPGSACSVTHIGYGGYGEVSGPYVYADNPVAALLQLRNALGMDEGSDET